MRTGIRATAGLAALAVFVAVEPAVGQRVYDPASNRTYERVGTRQTWPDAHAAALAAGTRLVRIDSEAENDVVAGLVGAPGRLWIGARDANPTEGVWHWADDHGPATDDDVFWVTPAGGGTPGPWKGRFSSWGVGAAGIDAARNYGEIRGNGSWNDADANALHGSVRERGGGNSAGVVFRGRTYTVISASTAPAAEAAARQMGGHLVRIDDGAENAFVANFAGALEQPLWIGASDAGEEGVWRWNDGGEQFWSGGPLAEGGFPVGGHFFGWLAGQPDNGANDTPPPGGGGGGGPLDVPENYAAMDVSGGWVDLSGDTPLLALVETPVPEPAGLTWLAGGLALALGRRRRSRRR